MKGFALLGGATGIGRLITGSIKSADSLQKLSIKLGTTTDFLSQLQYAANISGVEMGVVSKALEKMQKSANDASRGLSTARDGFDALGIEVEEFINLSPEQQFQLMIEKLGGVANQSVRTGTAMDLMGRSGSEMLKIVAGGPQVFNELMLKAEDLGGVLKQDTADGAAAVADAFTDVATVWSGLLRDAVLNATNGFISFANVLSDAGAFVREYSTEIKFVAVVLVELFVIRKISALIVAMSGAMKVATFSARGLGLALKGILGGIPGLIAMAATAWMMFRDETDEATESVEEQTEAVKKLRKEFAGMNLDQLIQRQRKLKTEFAEVSAELEQLNLDLEEARKLMANAPGGEGMIKAARDLQTAIVDAGDAVSVLADPELVELQDRYAELEALLAEVEKQIDDVTKSTDESTKAHKENAKAVADVVEGLTDADKAAVTVASAIARVNAETIKVEESLTEAEQALADWGDTVIDAQKESDLLIDKMDLLDQLFQDGKISGETYEQILKDIGGEFGDAADDAIVFTQEVENVQSAWEKMTDGIDSAWTDMWVGLFQGDGIDSVKDFLKKVKDLFLQTLAEIAAEWTKKKLIEMITGGTGGSSIFSTIGSIFTSGGETAGGGFISGITSAIGSGASKIGSIFSNIFGGGFSSSGTLVPGAAGGFQTVGANAATTFMGGLKTTLSSAAGFAVPLAIAAFGFGKSRKFRKQLRAKFAAVMSDPTIVANLADGPLAGGFKILGQVGEETFAQIGSASAEMFRHFSETSGGIFKDVAGSLGYLSFGLKEMKDEFGNVVVTAENFSGLLEYMKEMEPFSNHAQHLIDTIPHYQRAKDGISLIDSELLKAKVQFKNMGDVAKTALSKIDMGSQRVANIMQRDFVTAADWAAMGMENLGSMSSTMFEKLIAFAQDASGEMQNLATMANRSAAATQGALDLKAAAGFQHGGSFIVGGGGGTDSQRVAFMATPGERVSIETPNQSKAIGSDGSGVVRELRALRHDLATVVAKPIVGAVTRGQLAMAGGARH